MWRFKLAGFQQHSVLKLLLIFILVKAFTWVSVAFSLITTQKRVFLATSSIYAASLGPRSQLWLRVPRRLWDHTLTPCRQGWERREKGDRGRRRRLLLCSASPSFASFTRRPSVEPCPTPLSWSPPRHRGRYLAALTAASGEEKRGSGSRRRCPVALASASREERGSGSRRPRHRFGRREGWCISPPSPPSLPIPPPPTCPSLLRAGTRCCFAGGRGREMRVVCRRAPGPSPLRSAPLRLAALPDALGTLCAMGKIGHEREQREKN